MPQDAANSPADVTAEFSREQFPEEDKHRTPRSNADVATAFDSAPISTQAPPPQLPAGSLVDRFEVQGTLGAGGMGTVYEATDQNSGQRVALKLLSKSVRSTDESIQRFQRESQIAASINHPRSTFVYGAGQHEGQFYITMELMTGGTLDDIVKQDGPIEIGTAVDYVLDMIDGLRAAHRVGIVHRDLKPSNCFLDQNGRVKIGDFGLAKSFTSDSSLTQTGAFMGTPQYAAPEQLRTSEVDERTDIYAIGGTLFYLLLGRPPFVGNAAQVISSIASETPPRASSLDPSIPRNLCRLIHQTLEKNPDRRPENLDELREALLPFSTRGSEPADVGRRLAAFFLDAFVIFGLIFFASNFLGILIQFIPKFDFNLAQMALSVAAGIGYFTLLEYQFGTTLGKWLLGMRITTTKNLAPSFLQCLIRASLMPGLMYLAHTLPSYLAGFDPMQLQNVDLLLKKATLTILFQLGGWVVAALLLVTARKSNGYAGIHEYASDTRVVRLSGTLDEKRMRNVPITLPISAGFTSAMEANPEDTLEFVEPERSGKFKIVGELGRLGRLDSVVSLGRDDSLDRDVWVFELPSDAAVSSALTQMTCRPTRIRVLEVQTETDKSRVVTEAVKGMPLSEYVRITPNVDWREFRPLLQEIVFELDRAIEEGSLPDKLSLGQVWVDETGHAKLLDYSIRAVAKGLVDSPNVASESPEWNNEERELEPVELIKALLNVFVRHQVAPAHVLTFREEIDILNLEPDGLKQIGNRLNDLAELPSSWRWDDRLGVLAITLGLEVSLTTSLAISLIMLIALLEPPLLGMIIGTVLLMTITAFLVGFFTHGGPVFRVSGVLVRLDRTLQPASRFRCGLRNLVSWIPLTVITALFALILTQSVALRHRQSELIQDSDPSVLIGFVGILFASLFVFAGMLYSVLRPSRSIPDLICGTRLIRK